MTYAELLEITEARKKAALREINKALKGPAGFLAKAEIEKNPGAVAWHWLAKEFCETLGEHVNEFMENPEASDLEVLEVGNIYMAWQDDDPDLYDLLPVEAQLFTEE